MQSDSPTGAQTTAYSVKVACRVRPMLNTDSGDVCVSVVQNNCVVASENNQQKFQFDRVFGPESEQGEVFDEICANTIDPVLQGLNGTIFSYGATCSGKSYTIFGPDELQRGVIPRTLQYIFDYFDANQSQTTQYFLSISFLELYLERVRDLLNMENRNLQVFDSDACPVPDATEIQVSSISQITEIIEKANAFKVTAPNKINQQSSRSHCILILNILSKDLITNTFRISKLFLADLAGSEKISRTEAQGLRLKEAKNINKSLLALGKVVNCLTQHTNHVPYRDSKLTRLLKCALGGNSKTYLIVHISPTEDALQESLSSLLFASRARSVKNQVALNAYTDGFGDGRLAEELIRARDVIRALHAGRPVSHKTIDFYVNNLSDSEFLYKLGKELQPASAQVSFITNEPRTDPTELSETSISQFGHTARPELNPVSQTVQVPFDQFTQLQQDQELLNIICQRDNVTAQEHYNLHDICSQQENIFSVLKLQNLQLLKEKINQLNLEDTNLEGFTCLTYAAHIKFFAAIKLLISHGMDCLVRDDTGDLVIHTLLENTSCCATTILQSQYIDALDCVISNMEGQTALVDAASRFPIQILLQNGDQTDFKQQVLNHLIKSGFEIFTDTSTPVADTKWYAMLDCVYNKDQKSLEIILKHITQVSSELINLEISGAFRAFHLCIKLQNKVMLLTFLRTEQLQKAFINCLFQKVSALELAFQVQNAEAFEYLLKAGAIFDQTLLDKIFVAGELTFCALIIQYCNKAKYSFDQLLTTALSQGSIQLLEIVLTQQNYIIDQNVVELVQQIHGSNSQFFQFVSKLSNKSANQQSSLPVSPNQIQSLVVEGDQLLNELEVIMKQIQQKQSVLFIKQSLNKFTSFHFNQQYKSQILPRSRVNYVEYLYLNQNYYTFASIQQIVTQVGKKNLQLQKIYEIAKFKNEQNWMLLLNK